MARDLNEELERALADGEDAGEAQAAHQEPSVAGDGSSAPAPSGRPSGELNGKLSRKRGNLALLLGLLAMGAIVVVVFLGGFQEAAVYAMPTDQVVEKASTLVGRRLRVEGELVPGTLVRSESGCEYRFRIRKSGAELPVRFDKCVIPDTFRDRPEGGVEVTVEGEVSKDGKTFQATLIMAKCASKYDPSTHEIVLPDGTRTSASASPDLGADAPAASPAY